MIEDLEWREEIDENFGDRKLVLWAYDGHMWFKVKINKLWATGNANNRGGQTMTKRVEPKNIFKYGEEVKIWLEGASIYVTLSNNKISKTVRKNNMLMDYDSHGKIVGVEIISLNNQRKSRGG